jgi:hypothetical protein
MAMTIPFRDKMRRDGRRKGNRLRRESGDGSEARRAVLTLDCEFNLLLVLKNRMCIVVSLDKEVEQEQSIYYYKEHAMHSTVRRSDKPLAAAQPGGGMSR